MTPDPHPAPSPEPLAGPATLGSRLRGLLELLEADVAACYADLGLPGWRPRFTPVAGVLAATGPCSIRDLAEAIGVTHSAASQTVAQMARDGLVEVTPGADARRRMVALAPAARRLLPLLRAEWAATTSAVAELEAELPYPLGRLIEDVAAALRRRPLRDRIAIRMVETPRAATGGGAGAEEAGSAG